MGYIFIAVALFFGLVKTYCGKKMSYATPKVTDAIIVTTIRMLLCIFIGTAIALAMKTPSFIFEETKEVFISLLCGISTSLFTVSWLLAVRESAYMVVSVFGMGGVAVPLILCRALYGEKISLIQVGALGMLCIAVYLMCTYNKKEKIQLTMKNFLLLLACGLSGGLLDFSQKMYIEEARVQNVMLFNIYTYVFAAIVLAITYMILSMRAKEKKTVAEDVKEIMPVFYHIVIMAASLFLNSYFKTLAAKHLDAVLLYPLNQGLAVALSLVMAVTLFKEKINFKGLLGVALSVVSVIIINAC